MQIGSQQAEGAAGAQVPIVELGEVPSYHKEADLVIVSLIWNTGAPERRAHRRTCLSAGADPASGEPRGGADARFEVASWVRAAVSRARKQLVLVGNADFMRGLPAAEDRDKRPWEALLASPAVAHVTVE